MRAVQQDHTLIFIFNLCFFDKISKKCLPIFGQMNPKELVSDSCIYASSKDLVDFTYKNIGHRKYERSVEILYKRTYKFGKNMNFIILN